ncbi:MAG: hypothetical protein PWQ96_1106 [Clostridia bacterium]|jgi:hypothetical protein|nr:hypothetical protein [Clostridiales bacterium]MDK2985464.1 hypothetical protein [Clostridia bacterium]
MKTKLMVLLVVVLLVVMAYPVFAADKAAPVVTVSPQDEELQELYQKMWEIRQKIAEKQGIQLPDNNGRFFGPGFCGGYGGCGFGPRGGYGFQNNAY